MEEAITSAENELLRRRSHINRPQKTVGSNLRRRETPTQISKLSQDAAKPAAAGIGTTHFSGKRHFASYSGGALLRWKLTLPQLQR